jgi:hypothetical protein
MNRYVNYHKKPFVTYLTIQEYNQHFGTYLTENVDYQNYFEAAYKKARQVAGIDEFITTKIYTIEEAGWKEIKEKSKKRAKKFKEKLKKGAEKIKEKFKKKPKKGSSLDDALGMDPIVQPEYDDSETVQSIIHDAAKNADEAQQDLLHIILFNVPGMSLRDSLLKGRPKYLVAIKNYLNGDESAQIKMSFRKENKLVKIKDLNPDRKSLKKLLNTKPEGIRVVETL